MVMVNGMMRLAMLYPFIQQCVKEPHNIILFFALGVIQLLFVNKDFEALPFLYKSKCLELLW